MDEPRAYRAEWSKSEREWQVTYINAYIWNLERWCWCIYLQGRDGGTISSRREETSRAVLWLWSLWHFNFWDHSLGCGEPKLIILVSLSCDIGFVKVMWRNTKKDRAVQKRSAWNPTREPCESSNTNMRLHREVWRVRQNTMTTVMDWDPKHCRRLRLDFWKQVWSTFLHAMGILWESIIEFFDIGTTIASDKNYSEHS